MVKYFWHVHRKTKSPALGRMSEDGGVTLLMGDDYPLSEHEACAEWLEMFVQGTAMASEYEWSCAEVDDDDLDAAFGEAVGEYAPGMYQQIVERFSYADANFARA